MSTYPEPVANVGPEPPLFACPRCSTQWRWVWYAPLEGRYPHRWCAPPTDPCPRCLPVRDDGNSEPEVIRRMLAAGIPKPLCHVDLSKGGLLTQGRSEAPGVFMERSRRLRKTGILSCNAGALCKAHDWTPRNVTLLLHGPPGTGKTTWMAGIARRLLTRGATSWSTDETIEMADGATPCLPLPLPGQRTFRRKPIWAVEYHRVDQLVEREKNKMAGLDNSPVKDVAKCDLLMLDELCSGTKPTAWEVKIIFRILTWRVDRGLPTIIASNRSRDELIGDRSPYDQAVADRLRAATHAALGGPSWRVEG